MQVNEMTVLLACSASKSAEPFPTLVWNQSRTLESWAQDWNSVTTLHNVRSLYNGYTIKNQFALCEQHGLQQFILSAGAGLVGSDEQIPSYESTFQGLGPDVADWHKLPAGGLEKIQHVGRIITFAPPLYQEAIKHDPIFGSISNSFIVGSNSPLANDAGVVLPIHPRASEVLSCSKSHLSYHLLKLYIEEGELGFHDLFANCENLPEKRIVRKVSDSELSEIVEGFLKLGSLKNIVRAIRDTTDVAASYERIRSVRNKLLES